MQVTMYDVVAVSLPLGMLVFVGGPSRTQIVCSWVPPTNML